MKDLILGGIYLAPNNDYIVVSNKIMDQSGNYYFVILFDGDYTTQDELLTQNLFNKDGEMPYYIDDNNIMHYFNNGYCGRVIDNMFLEMQEWFLAEVKNYQNANNLIFYV